MDNLTAQVAQTIEVELYRQQVDGRADIAALAQAILAIPEIASALRDQAEFLKLPRLDR